jgi:ribonuclease J
VFPYFYIQTLSIPDTVSVLIETKAGTVMHSGDWNLDPTPVLGAKTDTKMLKEAGKAGILAYIGDSTNAEVAGRTGTELDVEKGLAALFKEIKGRIIVTIFASNVGRIRSIAKAAEACGRSVAIAGRSMHSMTSSARDCGYLKDTKPFLKEEDIGDLPAGRQVLIVTGSQGEPRAQLARIARADNKNIRLGAGDTVVFSSRAIPGNERKINEVKNNLSSAGVKIITPYDTPHKVHISGHPCRDEITDMLGWLKPSAVIPVHGERTQLEAQAALATSLGYKNVLVPKNGTLIRLDPAELEVVAEIETGVLAVEERRVLKAGHAAVGERKKLQHAGVIHITLVLSERGDLVADPQISTAGLFDETDTRDTRVKEEIIDEIEDILADMERADRTDDHVVHEEIRIGIRRFLFSSLRLKPTTTVHIIRV